MSKFYYKARDKNGLIIRGEIEAQNPWLARKALLKSGVVVLELGQFSFDLMQQKLQSKILSLFNKMSVEEKLVLLSQLESAYSVGMPIMQVLSMIREDIQNPSLREVITKLIEDVNEGNTLHQSFAKHPHLFDSVFVNLIRTGEATGRLDVILERIIQMTEQQASNRAKVKSALLYPKIVMGVMGIAVVVLVYVVIPKLKAFLKTFGTDLPPITQFVVGMSDFFFTKWYLILATGFGLNYLSRFLLRQPKIRLEFDRWVLKVPVFGVLLKQLELNNLCIILDILIGSGIPLMEGLGILATTQSNEVFKSELDLARKELEKGSSFTRSIQESSLFPASFKSMVSIGEESGKLQTVLQRLGRYYQVQIDYRLDNLSKLIEPILLFLIFGMVLVLALAIFLPIWKISSVRPN